MKDIRNYLIALLIGGIAFLGWMTYQQNKAFEKATNLLSSLTDELKIAGSKLKETSDDLKASNQKVSKLEGDLAKKNNQDIESVLLKKPNLQSYLSSSPSLSNNNAPIYEPAPSYPSYDGSIGDTSKRMQDEANQRMQQTTLNQIESDLRSIKNKLKGY